MNKKIIPMWILNKQCIIAAFIYHVKSKELFLITIGFLTGTILGIITFKTIIDIPYIVLMLAIYLFINLIPITFVTLLIRKNVIAEIVSK